MSGYYEKTFEVRVTAEVNEFTLRFPHRGDLRKIIVKQVDGTLQGYAVDLFNSKQSLSSYGASSASSEAVPEPPDAANFKIIPSQTVANGQSVKELLDVRYGYQNRDGSPSNPVRKLYVKIVPNTSVNKTFEITLGADTSDF